MTEADSLDELDQRPRTRRLVALLFLGSLLIQAAWIVTVPPFRGIDEFDHAYRAAAVAHGQWIADYKTPDQRGNLVIAPRSLIEAARPECYTYYYTTYDECNPLTNVGGGYATVASSAARYNPVYYWFVGVPSLWFSGTASLLAMRLAAALISSLMIAIIGWTITRWSRSRWPFLCLLIGLTPEVMYTSILPAPNSVELLGGLGVWAALLGVTRVRADPRAERQLLWVAAGMAVPLTTVRSLGPLWLGMIVLSIFAYWGRREAWSILKRNLRAWAGAIALVVAATLAGGLWAVLAAPNTPANMAAGGDFSHPFLQSTVQTYVWIFQSFAAFPTRGEIPPMWVYAIGLNVFAFMLIVSLRLATRRQRRLMLSMLIASLLVPWIITLSTYSQLGAVWQGRYTLPFALGVPVLAGLVLDANRRRLKMARGFIAGAAVLYYATYVGGVLYVLNKERAKSPQVHTGTWWVPPVWLVTALLFAGILLWMVGFVSRRSEAESTPAQTNSRDPITVDASAG